MLGQFFSSRKGAAASQPSATTNPDSAIEEAHTQQLLYDHPDAEKALVGHDGPRSEIDLEFPRDCRIIIAQDEFQHMPKAVLFDSKPAPPRAESPPQGHVRSRNLSGAGSSTAGPTFGGMHARRSSLVTESAPRSPTVAAFTRARIRGNSISSMPNIDEHAQTQAQGQGSKTTDTLDVVKTCLDCMFGHTTMSYRGNSNKLHIVPLDPRSPETTPTLPGMQDVSSSLGRADGFRKRSHLAKSFTPANLPADVPQGELSDAISSEPRRRIIFITRLFSVAVPEDDQDSSNVPTPTPQSSLGKGNGFPFPRTNSNASANLNLNGGAAKPAQPQAPRKTPMYAITIILHLPVATPSSSTLRPPSRSGPGNRGLGNLSTSAPGHNSLGSSLDSDRRAGWANIDGNFGVESFLSASLSSDVDDRVDVIGQHWDVIIRTLTSLQFVVQERIQAHFKMMSADAPSVLRPPPNQVSRYTSREAAYQPPRRGWKLPHNALASDKIIKDAVELAGHRVVSGMRIPRVLTGQGKWGVWREEARWLGRWAGRREENFFFFMLVTAFLGNHTEWLNFLGPKWHRKRHREQQKSTPGENLTISNRTVIVSPDKMAARRLIFLLAAFLPSSTSNMYDGASPMRPSTSASLRAYSQSPPTNMLPSRKHSLRRQINRRPRAKQSFTNVGPQAPASNTTSLPTSEAVNGRSEPSTGDRLEARHSRRSSAHSINTSLLLPSMSDSVSTKTGNIPASTIIPEDTVPIPQFALPRTRSFKPSPENMSENHDSLASANLMHTLQRSSTGHMSNPSTDSDNASRWSGFISFWSGGRRMSSNDYTEYLQTTDDGLGVSPAGHRAPEKPQSQLEQMVQELSMDRELFGETDVFEPLSSNATATADNSPETYPVGGSSGVPASAARPIPDRPRHFDSALKLSVNEKDGIIDVDIPLPDFGSPLQSPLMGGYTSASSQQGSSYGESSVLSVPHHEADQPVNAAGWLKQFHPDFAVQAIKPYADLERDVKRAMSAEPTPMASAVTPTLEQGPLERWVDVCSALVAETSTFTIKRIRLRRLVKLTPIPSYHQPAVTPGGSGMPGRSQYGNPYSAGGHAPLMSEVHLAEEFIEESIVDFDATLIDAIERILSQSGQSSRVQSATSSRSSSRRGRHDARASFDGGHQHVDNGQVDCKGIIFDALESVVKNVTAERNTKAVPTMDASGDQKSDRDIVAKTATDSSLKEGIRRWLSEVE
jgi:hypothetical protein